jgi:hypothetical protein
VALVSGLVVVAVAVVVLSIALAWQGYPGQKASLNNGGVWVTDSRQGLLGRENAPLQQLDLEVQSSTHAGDRLNVLQNGEAVIAIDDDASEVTPVETSLGVADTHAAVGVKDPNVQLGGDVAALTDPSGQVWATHVDTSGSGSPLNALSTSAKPLLKDAGANAALAITDSGSILTASATTDTLTTIRNYGGGFAKPSIARLSPDPSGTISQITAAGNNAVWLDSTGRVGFAGHALSVGEGAQLQQSAASGSSALVETPTKLLQINLRTAALRTLAAVTATTASAPVRLGDCAWGLWAGGSSAYVVSDCGGTLTRMPAFSVPADGVLVFRVNRGEIFVNDLVSGDVWALNGTTVHSVANWQSLAPKQEQQQKQTQVVKSPQQAAPQAVTDNLGARAGDSTVLHVLDNDRAPAGSILSIDAVQNDNKQITVQISPDRQTLIAQVDQGVNDQKLVFHYTIDDGERSNATATGEVDLTVHGAGDPQHARPQLMYGYAADAPIVYPVSAGGSVDVPVLSVWRDPAFGDPINLASATASTGYASITPQGLIRYVAPARFSGPVTINYSVTTSGTPNHGAVHLRVYTGLSTAPPTAEPDVASGVVGGPITIHPLNNDIPGADPVDVNAKLTLAAAVAPQAGLTISTNTGSGVVTVTGNRPGTYVLPYRAAYGSAAGSSTSDVKVIVQPQSQLSNVPIAIPATTAVYGASPMTVDVLANDYDPRGRLLVVQDAQPVPDTGQLNVAVIDGRWIRVSSKTGTITPNPQVIDYTVSNGDATASSTLTVTQYPVLASAQDGPDAQPDVATVRAGGSVDIPVLDNDSTPSGDPLGLVVDQAATTDGTLPLSSGPGTAYLDGNDIRFVAPSDVTEPTDSTFIYGVENTADPAAPQSSSEVTVHITPAPSATRPDQAPTPQEIDGRVTEGGTLTLQLPADGEDPDGDPVTVTKIGDPNVAGSEPQRGQVVAYGGDTITYQAFVGQTGADQFAYTTTDPYGQSGEGVVRITIVPPAGVQAPVAVDDSVTADPGRTLNIPVLANDLFPPGTTPSMEPLRDPPAGVSERHGIITVKPGSYGPSLIVPYTDTDGLAQSSANLIIHFQKGFDNPPIASPVVAKQVTGKQVATANVLTHVSDIDDPASALKLLSVDGAPAGAINGGTVTLPVTIYPRVWTYHVSDAAGAQAAGSIYVGGSSATLPYLKPDSLLSVGVEKSATVRLSDYVITPKKGTQPYLTTAKEIFEEPGSLFSRTVNALNQQSLSVQTGTTSGPADLIFQVSDMKNLSAKGADTAMITLPVIVGNPAPRLECPVIPISVPETGSVSVDVAAICHLWQNPDKPRRLSYSGTLASPLTGITLNTSGSTIKVTALDAVAGQQGVIDVNLSGAAGAAKLPLIITKLPPPSMRPVPELQTTAGHPVSVNLAPYLSSASLPPAAFNPAIVRVTPTNGGPPARISGATATFTPPANEHLTYNYAIEMSDAGLHSSRPLASSSVSIRVTDVPATVTGLHAGTQVLSDKVELQWTAPDAGGLQITKYVVTDQAGQTTCFTTSCTISGLHNGTTYSFTVVAYNSLGAGKVTSAAVSATPDAVPTAVTNLHVSAEGDGSITYQWDRPEGDFSAVNGYLVSGGNASGYQQIRSGARVVTDVVHATNGAPVSFSVRPVDHLGVDKAGPASTDSTGVASGQPTAPAAPSISGSNVAGGGTKAFAINWDQVAPNGRGSTYYEVLSSGRPVTCAGEHRWFTATTCTVQVANSGSTYSYQVVAANEAGVPGESEAIEGAPASHESPPSGSTSAIAAGEPAGVTVTLTPTGQTGQVQLSYTAGASNGGAATITCVQSTINCSLTVPASGGTGTKTIDGLTDGQPYNVVLQYCNGANNNQANSTLGIVPCATSSSASATPYGPMLSPALTASANGTAVTLTGSVVANGGNVSSTITDDTDGQSHPCGTGGPTGTVDCNWTETGLKYAATYKYTLTVTDASGNSRAAVTTTASGTTPQPPAINGAQLTATANGTSITASGSANGNGLPITVTVKSSDGQSKVCTGSGAVPCSLSESNLKYSTPYSYTLTAADASPYNRASATATAAATTGDAPPINGATLSASASGTSTSVTGSANGNGLAITVTISSSDGQSHSCSGSEVVSCSWGESGLQYATPYNYTLTASDASGNNRASATATASATTGPAPAVSVARGTAAPTSKCGGASSCYYIQTTTTNFPAGVTCQITASTYGLAGFITWTQGANATSNGPDAQENKSVTVQCSGGGQTASGSGSW